MLLFSKRQFHHGKAHRMKINYSFSFSQPAPGKPKLAEYSYSEFLLDLPPHWKQSPTSEDNSFNFYSEAEGASITVSAEFYAIPQEKQAQFADKCLESRHTGLETQFPGQVEVIRRTAYRLPNYPDADRRLDLPVGIR